MQRGIGDHERPRLAGLLANLRRLYGSAKVVFGVALWIIGVALIVWEASWYDAGTRETWLAGLAVFTWLVALVFGPLPLLSPNRLPIRHRGMMLAEMGLGALVASAPAVGLSLRLRVPFPGNTATAHSALMAMALAGMLTVFGAALLHLWHPMNVVAARLREQYRRRG